MNTLTPHLNPDRTFTAGLVKDCRFRPTLKPDTTEASELRHLSFEVISRSPSTSDEVAARLGRSILAIRPRVSELRSEGHIVSTETRRPSSSGHPQTVWQATTTGLAAHPARSLPVQRPNGEPGLVVGPLPRGSNPCAEIAVEPPAPPIVVRGQAAPAPARQAYVVGFLVGEATGWVVLAMPEGENTPDCVRNKWNGVGGKVEEGETFQAAMRREFREEAGLDIHSWTPVAHLDGDGCEIQFFLAEGPTHAARQMEKRTRICTLPIPALGEMQRNLAPNVLWILLMALSADRGKFLLPFASKEVR